MTWVTLTQTELMFAGYVGCARNVQAITRNWGQPHGDTSPNMWTYHIEGAAGEIAAAKFLRVYWDPIIGNPGADDVRTYQVRTNASRRLDDTCLHESDKPGKIYIGVRSESPKYEIMGWIMGYKGKRVEWFRPGALGRADAFWVPRGALEPMSTLPPAN